MLLLIAYSHKLVLNMSSIDWPCRMSTIKEIMLSAALLGAQERRTEQREDEGRKTGEIKGFLATAQLLQSSRSLFACCRKGGRVWAAGFGALMIQASIGLFVFSHLSPVVIRTVLIYSVESSFFHLC